MSQDAKYSVVHFPSKEVMRVAIAYRRPYFESFPVDIAPHFTILAPFTSRRPKEDLCRAIQEACSSIEPFHATIVGFDSFSNDKFVIFMKLADEDPMHELQEKIDLAIPEIDWRDVLKPGDKPRPHLTVAFFEKKDDFEVAMKRLADVKLNLRWMVRTIDLLLARNDKPESIQRFTLGVRT